MCLALGNAFPDSIKDGFIEDKLKVGTVLKAYVKDTPPPKEKRFIIVGFDSEKICLASVYINSEINLYKIENENLRVSHLSFHSEGRNYIDYNSFVDCSDLKIKKIEEIKELLKGNINSYLGELSYEDLKMVKYAIKHNRTTSPNVKKRLDYFIAIYIFTFYDHLRYKNRLY